MDTNLVEALESGIATSEQKGTAVKALQVKLATTLSNSTLVVLDKLQSITDLLDSVIAQLRVRMVNLDTWDLKEVISVIDLIESKQLQALDLLRKITQGRPLFSDEILSEDEKKVVELFKSFETEDQKKEFLSIVEKHFNK